MKRHQRFVEFYDVRDAAKALVNMNRKEINGKPVLIEFSRPGGNSRRRFPRPIPFSSPKPRSITTHSPPSPTPTAPQPPPPCRISPSSVQGSMDSLTIIRNESGNGSDWYNGSSRTNSKKSWRKSGKNSSSLSPSSSSSKQHPKKTGKPWKKSNDGGNDNDPRFMINEEEIKESSECRDSRTTVMIKNIPNKYRFAFFCFNLLASHNILIPTLIIIITTVFIFGFFNNGVYVPCLFYHYFWFGRFD